MNTSAVKTAIKAGPVGVLTLGAGGWVMRDELHYLLRPSVMETVAAVAALTGGILWARKASKGKAKDETTPPMQALPPSVPTQHFLSDGVVEKRLAEMVKSLRDA